MPLLDFTSREFKLCRCWASWEIRPEIPKNPELLIVASNEIKFILIRKSKTIENSGFSGISGTAAWRAATRDLETFVRGVENKKRARAAWKDVAVRNIAAR